MEMDWEKAKMHFEKIKEQYKSLIGMPGVNVAFALQMVFLPLSQRYDAGERTEELYNRMMGVK